MKKAASYRTIWRGLLFLMEKKGLMILKIIILLGKRSTISLKIDIAVFGA